MVSFVQVILHMRAIAPKMTCYPDPNKTGRGTFHYGIY